MFDIHEIIEMLDNSQDAETIALEITSNEKLNTALYLIADYAGPYCDPDLPTYMPTIIRELWDIAYSHGYYDGKTEAEEGII